MGEGIEVFKGSRRGRRRTSFLLLKFRLKLLPGASIFSLTFISLHATFFNCSIINATYAPGLTCHIQFLNLLDILPILISFAFQFQINRERTSWTAQDFIVALYI